MLSIVSGQLLPTLCATNSSSGDVGITLSSLERLQQQRYTTRHVIGATSKITREIKAKSRLVGMKVAVPLRKELKSSVNKSTELAEFLVPDVSTFTATEMADFLSTLGYAVATSVNPSIQPQHAEFLKSAVFGVIENTTASKFESGGASEDPFPKGGSITASINDASDVKEAPDTKSTNEGKAYIEISDMTNNGTKPPSITRLLGFIFRNALLPAAAHQVINSAVNEIVNVCPSWLTDFFHSAAMPPC